MSAKFLSCAVLICWISSLSVAVAQVRGPADVVVLEQHETSEPLRNIPPLPPQAGQHRKAVYHIPHHLAPAQPDPALQTQAGSLAAPATDKNFLGVGIGFSGPQGTFAPDAAPPDTNGAVGDTQYVQWVNESFAVFDKATGAVVYGPAAGNTLFQNMGGHDCQTTNDGDPIVQYDKAAKRWIMTQFAVSGGTGYYQCIAISTTSDATGPYYRYAAEQPYFNDYPKLGVWPDGYYMTFNMFSFFFVGARACALDRAKMLAGQSATMQCYQFSSTIDSLLPADLDGSTPPPAGSPNYLLNYQSDQNSLRLWKFHADFVNSGNSYLTGPTSMPVAAFSEACNGGGTCIPQLGTQQLLDSLGDRLMYRLAYRNFGDHQTLVVNHSIATPNGVGARWYELRNPGGTPTVFQQGTYAPDANYRWMGSIAMDHVGNTALGYSVSSTTMKPSIAYAGRTPADPLGTLGSETTIINGSGSQLVNLNRWGDYSSMSIDPVDDCTFWYTTEYLQSDGTFNWSTRVANFKFPSCSSTPPPPDFAISATPSSNTVPVGSGTSYTVTATSLQGFTSAVSLSVSGLPAGASGSFSPASVTPTGNSTLTITTNSSTPAGTYPLTITGTSGSLVHSTSVTLVVTGNFVINASPTAQTISRGNTATYTITLTRQNGFIGTVNLSVTGLPNGSSPTFNPASVTGTTSTLTIKTSRRTKTGLSTLTITGTSGSLSHSTSVTLNVQ